jgi:hypothetical protein
MLSFSEPSFDHLCPPGIYSSISIITFSFLSAAESGTVRAELILGGYVITPTSSSETLVTYVVQSDLKGSLPTSVVNLVSGTQPLIVFAIKKTLTEEFAKKGEPSKWSGKKFTYSGQWVNSL